ncbi:hypothetical protein BC939DRAFT_66277 [Gamsiella multidivaricata]|uniref:uncharacterized protein n=1 Tax=Gamsiella multidivaricata TaxID=101098 RepID=UPI0022206C21|nr:uncharacterized protein BC939DRAFT_66277 [Gamsiella multidivaricata]KAI7816056.1 hypothetical protein BC939DRAFT_66277 [Gamsiella multidivaricata]
MDTSDQTEANLFAGHSTIEGYTESLSLAAEQQQQQADTLQLQQEQIHTQPVVETQRRVPDNRPRRIQKSSSSSAYAAWIRAQATGSAYCTRIMFKVFGICLAFCFAQQSGKPGNSHIFYAVLVSGGALCLFFSNWISGVYSIVLGILVYLIEQTPPRRTSGSLAASKQPRISFLPSTVLRAQSIRVLFYVPAAVPCFLRAPNYPGGLCLISSGITYTVATAIDWRKKRASLQMNKSSVRERDGAGYSAGFR